MTEKAPAKKEEINLKVAEAVQDDVNKGIVRIDTSYMHRIGVKPGDIAEIEGERKTVSIVERAYPGDMGLNIIRMDGIARRNAKTGIGEIIKVRSAEVKEAKKIVIAPARKGVMVKANEERLKRMILGKAIVKGDILSISSTTERKTSTSFSSEDELMGDISKFFEEALMPNFGFVELKFIVADTTPKGAVVITEATELALNPEAVELEEEAAPEVTYEDIGGLSDEIKKIREMVELPLKHPEIFERLGIEAPKGVLLHGPPGTGKTLLAKAVANETNSHFIVINGPEIMSKYYGQSEENLRKKFEEGEQNAPSIIFIDEIDAIAPKREEVRGEVERRVVAQLLSIMDGLKSRGKVVVIAATNVPNILDPALRRPGRFDREIEIGVPSRGGREGILKIHTRNMPLAKNVNLSDLADITYGFVGADLSSLCKEAAMNVLRRVLPELRLEEEEAIPAELLEKLKITNKDFKEALKVVRPSALREVLVEIPNVKWEDVGGLQELKQQLQEAVEWPLKYPEAFKRMGVRPPRGILLYGAPGTGKTMLAKAVAHESKSNFILVKGPELLSKWVGESEKAVREIFKKARQTAPSIIFFDEIDSLAPRRDISTDAHVTETVVNQMLTEMDGLEELNDVVVIAATNRPDLIDTALLRPGRFDRIILTPVPDKSTRKKIFEVHTKGMPINYGASLIKDKRPKRGVNIASKMAADEPVGEEEAKELKEKSDNIKESSEKDTFLAALADESDGYVGADIEAVCREAAMIALRKDMKAKEITMKDFQEAMKEIGPSSTSDVEKAYEELKDNIRAARGKEMKENKPAYFG